MAGTAGTSARDTEIRLPRATVVKNKQPADKQITAEQILREARELQEQDFKPPTQKITDPTELAEYRLRKRKEFEDLVRRVRWNHSVWVKYAQWEEGQKDFRRSRSVWERALEVSYTNATTWLKYAEMEMRHRFVNHARNVWDRAVTLLPRVDQLWYKYIHMEEMLGNVPGARQIFERWMNFEPDHHGWMAFIKMELRYNEVERSRGIFERYVQCLPTVKAWVRYAKFEMQNGAVDQARTCYERSVEQLAEDAQTEELFIKFAEFEEKVKELDRARAIYKYALDHIPRAQADTVYRRFVAFEKQHGDRDGIEDVILSERRFQYEAEVSTNPLNYDAWFDYVRLEEAAGNPDRVREAYERAIANVPPAPEKRFWQRYIYLWINYALWEELDARDSDRTREVYRACLKLIPHTTFTFAKVWILAAQFEIRQLNLDKARTILGMALGICPKSKMFRAYVELETQLGSIERCRKLYERFLDWDATNCQAWCKWAELERSLGETERVRALFERLLDRTRHVKVWISFAEFEAAALPQPEEQEADGLQNGAARSAEGEAPAAREAHARSVYARAYKSLREGQPDAKEEAVMLLESWRAFESNATASPLGADGVPSGVAAVERKMPKRVKRKRTLLADDGSEEGFEEYYDYIFPDEAGVAPNLKLLEAAQRWKQQQAQAAA